MGKLIGWGEGQTEMAVQTTRELTKNLTRTQVQAFKNQGLTKEWVEEQLDLYNNALSNPRKAGSNVNLLPRKELMEKLLYLWRK